MFNRIIRSVIRKSEKCVVKKLINDVKKVYGKDVILFNIAEACLEQPDGTIQDKIFPIRHIKNYFLSPDNLKNAQSKVANALFKIRLRYGAAYQ